MSQGSWIGRRRSALLEAAGLLEDSGVDQTQPIDVFGLIGRLDLWLTFVPMDTTLGACIPVGRGGIMITTRRQPAVQRYTAAHEIGHWTHDHDRLLLVSPLAAKRDLAHGIRPVVGNADIWPIDERWNGAHLDVTTQDEIVIALPENRTTGY